MVINNIHRPKTKAKNRKPKVRNRKHLNYNTPSRIKMRQMLEEQWEGVQMPEPKIWAWMQEVVLRGPDLGDREMILNHSKMLQSIWALNLMLWVSLKKIFRKLEIFLGSEDLIKKVSKLINRLLEMSMIWLKTIYKWQEYILQLLSINCSRKSNEFKNSPEKVKFLLMMLLIAYLMHLTRINLEE